jgi:hypothetical protein
MLLPQMVSLLDEFIRLDNWDMFETDEKISENFQVSPELAERIHKTITRNATNGRFTGSDILNDTLDLILQGFFNNEADARSYLEIFKNKKDNENFAFFDAYGFWVTLSLLEEAINLKWGTNANQSNSG